MRFARLAVLVSGLTAVGCHSSTTPTTTTTATTTATTLNLTVSGSSVLTGLRERSQMSAIVLNDDGTTQDVTKTTTWLAADPAVATISSSGVVTTVGAGATHLTAIYQTTNQGFDIAVAPVATTFNGVLQSSDGRNGTFTIVVHSAVDPTPNTISTQVSGTIQLPGSTLTINGFFESLTGAITFSGVEMPYRFGGTIANGSLTATFDGPDGVTGVIVSTSETVG